MSHRQKGTHQTYMYEFRTTTQISTVSSEIVLILDDNLN